MKRIIEIQNELEALKEKLTTHRLYTCLRTVEDIKVFMEGHVVAVWDFMSLLKALQNRLTCTKVPWRPVKNAKLARFVNEIVWGEESDVNEMGITQSHFEMYLDAMTEVGANTIPIHQLIGHCTELYTVQSRLEVVDLLPVQRKFLQFTFETIQSGEPHKIAAAFTFGREDLIPDLFLAIINDAQNTKDKLYPRLRYYLERHIEIDGEDHGPLSLEMVSELCGEEDYKWEDALRIAVEALIHRIRLWDAIADRIEQKHEARLLLNFKE